MGKYFSVVKGILNPELLCSTFIEVMDVVQKEKLVLGPLYALIT